MSSWHERWNGSGIEWKTDPSRSDVMMWLMAGSAFLESCDTTESESGMLGGGGRVWIGEILGGPMRVRVGLKSIPLVSYGPECPNMTWTWQRKEKGKWWLHKALDSLLDKMEFHMNEPSSGMRVWTCSICWKSVEPRPFPFDSKLEALRIQSVPTKWSFCKNNSIIYSHLQLDVEALDECCPNPSLESNTQQSDTSASRPNWRDWACGKWVWFFGLWWTNCWLILEQPQGQGDDGESFGTKPVQRNCKIIWA